MPRQDRGRGLEDLTGVFRAHAPGFREWLRSYGYSPSALKSKLLILTEIDRWFARHGSAPETFEESKLRQFLEDPNRGYRTVGGVNKTACQVLQYLRSQHAIAAGAPRRPTPIEEMQELFASFLRTERGLAESSIDLYVRAIQHFLADCAHRRRPLSELTAADITRYVLAVTHKNRLARAKTRLRAIRWFLRFLSASGRTAVNLAPAVPKVAEWREAEVPRFIPATEVRRLLHARNPRSRSGSLDYAVLSILARLGLRAGEVAAIKLDDLDWDTAELTVHGKGLHDARVPLPVDVGRAIARYLRRDRPRCTSRCLFVSSYAPHRPFTTVGISVLVRRAIRRSGLKTPTKGAHLLRHSLATHILRRGGSLPEIADLLRHRSMDTTTIYAKVDFKQLRAIAPKWPGSEL